MSPAQLSTYAKYKEAKEKRSERRAKKRFSGFQKLCFVYLFAVFALPQYFGIQLPGFALTAQRMALICVFVAIFINQKRADEFFITNTGPMLGSVAIAVPFIFISLATAIFRSDPNSFFNFFVDAFLPMIIMMYLAAKVFTLEELLRFLKIVLIVVCITCYLDALVLHRNPYDFIHTIKSIAGGSTFRASSYRVAAMTSHPIALGMYFVLMTPLMCIDVDRRRINIAKNWGLLLLISGSMLLCGSRMPQATFLVELVALFMLTERDVKRAIVPYMLVFGTFAVLVIYLLRDESHIRRYVILNVYQMVDSVFGTTFVLEEFGYWQWKYIQSWDYRNLLPLLLFSDDYDPLLGLGVKAANYDNFSAVIDGRVVASIDNYYVIQYLQFAWPGLIAMVMVFLYTLKRCVVGLFDKSNVVCRALLVSACLYFVNLWFVADLGTFKYAFSLFALVYVYSRGEGLTRKADEPEEPNGSLVTARTARRREKGFRTVCAQCR